MQPRQPPTPQKELPKLPVPALHDTLARYVDIIKATLSEAQYDRTVEIIKDFGKPGGVGEKLQEELLKYAENEDNWVKEGDIMPTWWGVVWCGVVWCGVVWCGVVWCGVVWCGVVWCGVVWCGVVWCGVVWCGVVWCGVVWCGVVWYCVVWCGGVWCCVVWCGVVWCGVV